MHQQLMNLIWLFHQVVWLRENIEEFNGAQIMDA